MANSKPNDPSQDSGRQAEAKAERKPKIIDNTNAPEAPAEVVEAAEVELRKGVKLVNYS